MEQFKIDHFIDSHKDSSFPNFHTLNAKECRDFCESLKASMEITIESESDNLASEVYKLQHAIDTTNAQDEIFCLKDVISFFHADVESIGSVFINWYRFDNIDSMQLEDLSKYFDDIWYPSSDDIDIFDSTIQWVLSITHVGDLYLWQKS